MQSSHKAVKFKDKSISEMYDYMESHPLLLNKSWQSLINRVNKFARHQAGENERSHSNDSSDEQLEELNEDEQRKLKALQSLIQEVTPSATPAIKMEFSRKHFLLSFFKPEQRINYLCAHPPELRLEHINLYLSFTDLTRLRAVSKRFYEEVNKTFVTQKVIQFDAPGIVFRTVGSLQEIANSVKYPTYERVLEMLGQQSDNELLLQVEHYVKKNEPRCIDALCSGWNQNRWTADIVAVSAIVLPLAGVLGATLGGVAWLTVKNTPASKSSAMNPNLFMLIVTSAIFLSLALLAIGMLITAKILRDGNYQSRLNQSMAFSNRFFGPSQVTTPNEANDPAAPLLV